MGKLTQYWSISWTFIKARFLRLDKLLLLLCIVASGFSVYLLYTMRRNGINPDVITSRTWKVQMAAAMAGLTIALGISLINYKFISRLWFIYAPAAIALSLLLFTPLAGSSTTGSDELNWIDLGVVQIQPSEFLTVAFIMTFATHLQALQRSGKLNHLPQVLLLCLHAVVPTGIMVAQGNMGAPMIVLLVFLVMIFMAGISWKYIAAAVATAPVLGWLFWNYFAKEYHKLRILVIFDETLQQQEIRRYFHQQSRSLMAMSSGGLSGQGLEGGEYISIFAMHNDFIFSYIGMTLGLIGCILVLLLLLAICIKLLAVMGAAKDSLGRSICAGAFALVFFNTVINVGMAIVVTPVVGVPLPLISAGGSSTLSLYIALGLVLSVWAHRKKEYRMFYTETE